MMVFFIGSILLITNTSDVKLYFVAYFFIFGGLVITSLGHVLAFKTKSTLNSSSDKKSGNSSNPQTIEKSTTTNVISAELEVV